MRLNILVPTRTERERGTLCDDGSKGVFLCAAPQPRLFAQQCCPTCGESNNFLDCLSLADQILELNFYRVSNLRCVLRKVVWWSDSKSDQYLAGNYGKPTILRITPSYFVLLLFQVFDLQVEVWQFLIDPVQPRPYHSETKHRY